MADLIANRENHHVFHVIGVWQSVRKNWFSIMSISASRKIFASLSTMALAALSLTSVSAMAQELKPESAPLGLYAGATFGLSAAQWHCGSSCDRVTFSGKLFGGKRITPGLAAEVNYMFFGGMDRANDAARTAETGEAAMRQKERAVTVGINWEVELKHGFTNQLRAGWAFTRQDQKITKADNTEVRKMVYDSAPYVGAGIAFQVNREVKLLSGFDYIINGHESQYLFSVGASAEF